jgi:octaprenyl-diphosphate synthase
MEDQQYGPRVKELFLKKDVTDADVSEALDLILKTDSVDRCLSLAADYAAQAKADLSGLQESKYKDALLSLADYVVGRDR